MIFAVTTYQGGPTTGIGGTPEEALSNLEEFLGEAVTLSDVTWFEATPIKVALLIDPKP